MNSAVYAFPYIVGLADKVVKHGD